MTDPNSLSVRDLAEAIRSGTLRAPEVTAATLDRIARVNPALNAIVQDCSSDALAEAEALDARIALFAGQPESLLQDAFNDAVLTSGAITLVRTMRANGARAFLVSGGFTAITGPIAAACGVDGHHANRLEIVDGDAKAHYLRHYCSEMEIDAESIAAIGDGTNDLAMLTLAGCGVAFRGKPALRQAVSLQLNHTDLTGLLYLQGYHAADFVTD